MPNAPTHTREYRCCGQAHGHGPCEAFATRVCVSEGGLQWYACDAHAGSSDLHPGEEIRSLSLVEWFRHYLPEALEYSDEEVAGEPEVAHLRSALDDLDAL